MPFRALTVLFDGDTRRGLRVGVLVVHHHHAHAPGELVGLLRDRAAVDEVLVHTTTRVMAMMGVVKGSHSAIRVLAATRSPSLTETVAP